MKTPKLTTCEKRAKAFCDSLKQYDGGSFAVEWRKSATWGSNPVILWRGDKCCSISGCGYDKLSAALASVLCFLFPVGSEQYDAIAPLGGTGESSVMGRLKDFGWNLEKTASGRTFDAYSLGKICVGVDLTKGGN